MLCKFHVDGFIHEFPNWRQNSPRFQIHQHCNQFNDSIRSNFLHEMNWMTEVHFVRVISLQICTKYLHEVYFCRIEFIFCRRSDRNCFSLTLTATSPDRPKLNFHLKRVQGSATKKGRLMVQLRSYSLSCWGRHFNFIVVVAKATFPPPSLVFIVPLMLYCNLICYNFASCIAFRVSRTAFLVFTPLCEVNNSARV